MSGHEPLLDLVPGDGLQLAIVDPEGQVVKVLDVPVLEEVVEGGQGTGAPEDERHQEADPGDERAHSAVLCIALCSFLQASVISPGGHGESLERLAKGPDAVGDLDLLQGVLAGIVAGWQLLAEEHGVIHKLDQERGQRDDEQDLEQGEDLLQQEREY